MRRGYNKSDPLLALKEVPSLNTKYHVKWGTSNGVVGKVIGINITAKTCTMISPSTGMIWKNPVKFEDLRYLRKKQREIENTKQNN